MTILRAAHTEWLFCFTDFSYYFYPVRLLHYITTIMVCCVLITPNSMLRALQHIPRYISHYHEHTTHQKHSFKDFLKAHITHDNKHHQEHDHSPLQQEVASPNNIFVLAMPVVVSYQLHNHTQVHTVNAIIETQLYPSAFLHRIWQPPRLLS